MTSIVQSINQEVIVSFKQNYHKNLHQEILPNCDEKDVSLNKFLKNITLIDVIFWTVDT